LDQLVTSPLGTHIPVFVCHIDGAIVVSVMYRVTVVRHKRQRARCYGGEIGMTKLSSTLLSLHAAYQTNTVLRDGN